MCLRLLEAVWQGVEEQASFFVGDGVGENGLDDLHQGELLWIQKLWKQNLEPKEVKDAVEMFLSRAVRRRMSP